MILIVRTTTINNYIHIYKIFIICIVSRKLRSPLSATQNVVYVGEFVIQNLCVCFENINGLRYL